MRVVCAGEESTMKRATIAGGALVTALALLGLALAYRGREEDARPAAPTPPAIASSLPLAGAQRHPPAAVETHPPAKTHQGFLYGRITALRGASYEGRLRWGRGQEAFWGDYFNGAKDENPWVAHLPIERLPKERPPFEIFGIELGDRKSEALARLFMARFGDLARIEARGRDVRVTLKSGTVFDLDRFEASDFDDGVRVWDARHGVVDLDSLQIRSIELLPTAPSLRGAPYRLHGTVRTRRGDFTGFIQWDRAEGVGPDELDGRSADGALSLRFDTIRSIARRSPDSGLVTLLDGREIVLSGSRRGGLSERGIYVDDRRFGRVLVSWSAFERVDFSPGGSGPAYGDFPPGRPLTGSVTTRAGRRLAGRLVYDLDESETTETLDAPSQGVDYTIPFGLVASIVPAGGQEGGAEGTRVILHDGEELRLEPTGDLGERNGGLLIFVDGHERAEHVPWTDVGRVDFDRPPATYPPLG
jgi:hypothetical protein